MRSKLAKRSRSDIPRTLPPGGGSRRLDQLGAAPYEARVDRHRLCGRLPEVEALAEVDAELAHRLELVDALDALGDDAAALLVGDLDERGDEPPAGGRVLDARGHGAGALADGLAQLPEAGQRLRTVRAGPGPRREA